MNIRYISISGNTRSFVQRLTTYAEEQHLDGGDGINNGNTEILTEVMREYLAFENNYRYCSGVVGSGNKNFNHQYCLTAKQYAEQFNFPFLADYELRGTQADIERIYAILKKNQ